MDLRGRLWQNGSVAECESQMTKSLLQKLFILKHYLLPWSFDIPPHTLDFMWRNFDSLSRTKRSAMAKLCKPSRRGLKNNNQKTKTSRKITALGVRRVAENDYFPSFALPPSSNPLILPPLLYPTHIPLCMGRSRFLQVFMSGRTSGSSSQHSRITWVM